MLARIVRAVFHMYTVIVATMIAAAAARKPSHRGLFSAWAKKTLAMKLATTATPVPQYSAGRSAARPVWRRMPAVMAMIRKASMPSRRVMIRICNTVQASSIGCPAVNPAGPK